MCAIDESVVRSVRACPKGVVRRGFFEEVSPERERCVEADTRSCFGYPLVMTGRLAVAAIQTLRLTESGGLRKFPIGGTSKGLHSKWLVRIVDDFASCILCDLFRDFGLVSGLRQNVDG